MQSAIGQLINAMIGYGTPINKLIAKKLYDDYHQAIFLSQDELAKQLHLSKSVITDFSKKIGYTGYRQLREQLNEEYKKYELSKNKPLNNSFQVNEMIARALKNVNLENPFFKKLSQEVNRTKKLTIITSLQALKASEFIVEYLNSLTIDAKILSLGRNYANLNHRLISENEPILFIFTGPDNYSNYNFYEKIKTLQNHEFFVITTTGQENRTDAENKFVIISNTKYFDSYVREVILKIIFLEIFK